MIFGKLHDKETYWLADRDPVLKRVFDWLKSMPETQPSGIIELEGRSLYVNVHGYETLPRDECVFESHRVYADLQYCISGGELIDYAWRGDLGPVRGAYDQERDFVFNDPPPRFSTLVMESGCFGIFLPSDAHRPRVYDGCHPNVKKLVVKIDLALLR
jgi:YhcH/YjgK/YiaL family protein